LEGYLVRERDWIIYHPPYQKLWGEVSGQYNGSFTELTNGRIYLDSADDNLYVRAGGTWIAQGVNELGAYVTLVPDAI